jgi:hypothetical protein
MASSSCILEQQKNAVIRMLTIAEKNDLDDDDDMELPESKKSKKSASKKHIVTGSDLGATLTQRKIQRWKVLLLDSFTQKMLQPLLNVGDLRALGVTLIMYVFLSRLNNSKRIGTLKTNGSLLSMPLQFISFNLQRQTLTLSARTAKTISMIRVM